MKTAAILLAAALVGCSAGATDVPGSQEESGNLAANQEMAAAEQSIAEADEALAKAEEVLAEKIPTITIQIPGSVVIECKGTQTETNNFDKALGATTVQEPFDMTLMIDNVGRRLFVLLEEEQAFTEMCEDCDREVLGTKVTWRTSSIDTDEAGITTSLNWSGWIDRRTGKGTEDSTYSRSRRGEPTVQASDRKKYECRKVDMPLLDPAKRKF